MDPMLSARIDEAKRALDVYVERQSADVGSFYASGRTADYLAKTEALRALYEIAGYIERTGA